MTIPTAEQCCGNCRNWRHEPRCQPGFDPANYGLCCSGPPRAHQSDDENFPLANFWPPTTRKRWCAQWEPSEQLMPSAEAQLRTFLDASSTMAPPGADPFLDQAASVREQLEALTYDDEPPRNPEQPPLPRWANDPFDDPLS